MSAILIEQALIRRFLAMPTPYPRVRPNEAGNAVAPLYMLEVSGTAQSTMGGSSMTEATHELMIRVDTPEDTYATLSNQMVQAIIDWFPVNLRFDNVVILEAPNPRPPYKVNGVYSVPVLIRGRGYF